MMTLDGLTYNSRCREVARTVIHLEAHRPVLMVRDPGEPRNEREAWDALMKRPYHALGLDYQGRFPQHAEQPDPGAQCASVYGNEDAERQIRGVPANSRLRWTRVRVGAWSVLAVFAACAVAVWRAW